MSVSGGCEAVWIAGIRCGWVMSWDCYKILYGKRSPLRLRGSVYRSYVGLAIMYGCVMPERE